MLRHLTTLLAAAFLATSLSAADTPASYGGEKSDKRREERKKLSPEERKAKVKEWEERREKFKNLTPEEREAQRKEFRARLDKRLAELREKETNGTITPDQARELKRGEQILKRFKESPRSPDDAVRRK